MNEEETTDSLIENFDIDENIKIDSDLDSELDSELDNNQELDEQEKRVGREEIVEKYEDANEEYTDIDTFEDIEDAEDEETNYETESDNEQQNSGVHDKDYDSFKSLIEQDMEIFVEKLNEKTCKELRTILKNCKISSTGTKNILINKLAGYKEQLNSKN